MKKIILQFLLLGTFFAKAQVGVVHYGHIESPGLGSAIGKDYNAYLTFNALKSYYVTAKDSLENIQNQLSSNSYTSKNGEKSVISNGSIVSIQGNQVGFNRKENTLSWNVKEGKMYYINEENPKHNWIITKDKKKIGTYVCTKAKTVFRGRTYTVWYTEKIPLPYGPWKLNGLPGLILEAYDTNREMYLYFKSVEYPVKNNLKVDNIRKAKNEEIKYWTLDEFIAFRKKTMEKANTASIIMAKENNWPTSEPVKMIDAYIESFE